MYNNVKHTFIDFLFENFNDLLFKLLLQIERREMKHFNREKSHSKFENIIKTIDKIIDAC